MSQTDGSIRIDTKIDDSDLPKQLSAIKKNIEKTTKSINKMKMSPELNADKIKAALTSIEVQTKKLGAIGRTSLKEGFSAGFAVVKTALVGITVAAAAAGVALWRFSAATSRIADLSQKIGVSRQAFQELDYALTLAGGSIESLEMGMKSFREEMIKAKSGTSAFTALGVSATDTNGALKDQDELLFETIKKFETLSDGAEKARLAEQLFGRAGTDLMPLLNGQAGSIEEMRKQAHQLGIVLNDEVIDAGDKFGDTFDTLRLTLKGLLNQVIAPLVPIITDMMQSFIDWASTGDNLKNTLSALGYVIAGLGSALTVAWIAFSAGPKAILAVKMAMLGLNAAMAANPIGAIATAITAVLIPALIWCWFHWNKLVEIFEKYKKQILAGLAVASIFAPMIAAIVSLGAVIMWAAKDWEGFKNAIRLGITYITTGFQVFVATLKLFFTKLWNNLKIEFWSFVRDMTSGVLGVIEKVLQAASKIPGIGSKFRTAANAVTGYKKSLEDMANGKIKASQNAIKASEEELDAVKRARRDEINATKEANDARLKALERQKKADKASSASARKAAAERAAALKQETANANTVYAEWLSALEKADRKRAAGVSNNEQMITDKINAAIEAQQKFIDLEVSPLSEKFIEVSGSIASLKSLLADATVQATLEDYAKAVDVINAKTLDGTISEEEARQQQIDLISQQMDALYALGYSAEAAALGSTSGGNLAIIKLQKDLKILERSKVTAFAIGKGVPEGIADGIQAGLHYATKGVKLLVRGMAAAFDTMMGIFSGAFNILSWVVDFNPADMYDSLSKFITGLQEFFEKDIGSIPLLFNQAATLVTAFLDSIMSHLPAIIETIGNVITGIVDYLSANSDKIIKQVLSIVFALVGVLVSKMPDIFAMLFQALVSLLEGLTAVAPSLINGIMQALVAMVLYVGEHAGELIKAFTDLMIVVILALINNLPDILGALSEALPEIIYAIVVVMSIEIIKASPQILAALLKAILMSLYAVPKGLAKGLYNVGKNIVKGISEGIKNFAPEIWAAMKSALMSFVKSVKSFLGIHSPSTVFFSIGADIITGLINGIIAFGALLLNTFVSIFNSVFMYLSALPAVFASVGLSLCKAVLSGFTTLGEGIGNAFTSALSVIEKYITNFANLGEQFGQAILNGFKNITSSLASVIKALFDSVVEGIVVNLKDAVTNTFKKMFNDLAGTIVKKVVSAIKDILPGGGGGGFDLGDLNPFASGTRNAPGGMSLVGEEGPELVELPAHSRVYTAQETKKMLAGYNSIASGISSGLTTASLSPNVATANTQAITLNNKMTGSVVIDGREIGRIAFENIDRIYRAAYGH